MTNRRPQRIDAALQSYAAEKLGAAVLVLATHPHNVQSRLRAAGEHLLMVPVEALPPDVRKRFVKVIPRDYTRMLEAIARAEEQGLVGEEAIMVAFEENARDLSRVGGN